MINVADKPNRVSVPRSFFVDERLKNYNEWLTSFWRELIQNSVDAKSKTIEITIETGSGVGSFGDGPEKSAVTRVVFADDGCGMTNEVLEDVYFAIHGTTKKESDSVGGFGRARLMTCFSHLRYTVETGERRVQGIGGDYKNWTRPELMERLGVWIDGLTKEVDRLEAVGERDRVFDLDSAINKHRSDLQRLSLQDDFVKGCRLEIDLDPDERGAWDRKATVSNMESKLFDYLKCCDIPCDVVINGRPHAIKKPRIQKSKKIMVNIEKNDIPSSFAKGVEILDCEEDGRVDVVFGKIGVVSSDAEWPSNRLIVRVNGVPMFSESVQADGDTLVLDLSSVVAREALTSNRDSFKAPYSDAVYLFKNMVLTNRSQAFENKILPLSVVPGGKGLLSSKVEAVDFSMVASMDALANAVVVSPRSLVGQLQDRLQNQNWDSCKCNFYENIIFGIPRSVYDQVFSDAVKNGITGFLLRYPDQKHVKSVIEQYSRYGLTDLDEKMGSEFSGFLVTNLRLNHLIEQDRVRQKNVKTMKDLHDFPIRNEIASVGDDWLTFKGMTKEEYKKKMSPAVRKLDPRNWDIANGKGVKSRKILSVWQICVENCIKILTDKYPNRVFDYSVGWLIAAPSLSYDYDYKKQVENIFEAMYVIEKTTKDLNEKVRYFLLNPLDLETNNLKYNLSDPADIHKILVLAAHEVAHEMSPESHGERFAYVFTDIMSALSPKKIKDIYKQIDQSFMVIDRLSVKGHRRTASMDSAEGIRPISQLDEIEDVVEECDNVITDDIIHSFSHT